ncbi:unnamed protein product [Somion occarium]|uniref:Uncharacterized protein n=1 Tax=Somion occarium TaxID=3059160 RepID=A0ABP1D6N1_9APHY
MFSFISASFAILLAASQVAAVPSGSSPSVAKRITGCDGLGSGTVNTLFTFRLTASGGTNKGEDLVLVDSGENVGDADIFVLATRNTVPTPFVPTFSLNNAVLTPDGTNQVDLAVAAGELPGFAANHGEGGHIYCAAPVGGNFVLAVNGDKSSFALCFANESPNPRRFVVYKPDSNHPAYNSKTCQSVQLNIVDV